MNNLCSCEKSCPFKFENNLEFNLSKNQKIKSNPIENASNNEYSLTLKYTHSNNFNESMTLESLNKINEIKKLNAIKKIIKNYRIHLTELQLTEKEDFSNTKKYKSKYNKGIIIERMEKINKIRFMERKKSDNDNEIKTKRIYDIKNNRKFEEIEKNENDNFIILNNECFSFNNNFFDIEEKKIDYNIKEIKNFPISRNNDIKYNKDIYSSTKNNTLSSSINKDKFIYNNIIKNKKNSFKEPKIDIKENIKYLHNTERNELKNSKEDYEKFFQFSKFDNFNKNNL